MPGEVEKRIAKKTFLLIKKNPTEWEGDEEILSDRKTSSETIFMVHPSHI